MVNNEGWGRGESDLTTNIVTPNWSQLTMLRRVSLRHESLWSTVTDKAVNKLHSNVFRSKLTLRRL